MKRLYPKTWLLFGCLFTLIDAHAQSDQYYVVVGAFAKESSAEKFNGSIQNRLQSALESKDNRNMVYVYVIKTQDEQEAIKQAMTLQKDSAFNDCWVFSKWLDKPLTQSVVLASTSPVIYLPQPKSSIENSVKVKTELSIPSETVKPVDEPVKPKRVVKGKLFRFDIKAPSGESIVANVHHVDFKRGRDLGTYSSSDYNDVLRPSGGLMTLVCGVFGYREVTQLVDYKEPALTEGVTRDAENAWVVPFKLERLEKGDVSIMYDVSFYKDAVMMLPRSHEELDELVDMMKANPGYTIKIHGHANGTNKRKIITMGETKSYFTLQGSNQITGSAKELSKQRADAVRNYLVDHGIDPSRMKTLAWGGTNMLADENSPNAKLNDRIEIEILSD